MNTVTVLKKCSSCKVDLPVEHFHANKTKKDGLSCSCKECHRVFSRAHYERNKQKYFDKNQETRRKQQARLLEIKKETPCFDCGNKFHPYVMEFDHVDPSQKKFSMGRTGGVSNKQLKEEMAKCNLVCANCHKLRTFRRHQLSGPRYVHAGVE